MAGLPSPEEQEQNELDVIFAGLIAGLQVPVSMGLPLGAARTAYSDAVNKLNLMGWQSVEEVYTAIKKARQK